MRRLLLFVSTAAIVALATAAAAQTAALPVIVTYELQKARIAERMQAQNPRTFWFKQIVTRISDKARGAALNLGQPATVGMTFTVSHDGHIVSQAVAKPSGVKAADETAGRILAEAAPFPPMPASMSESDLTFTVPLRFR